jgi:hypothetical protein
MKGFKAWIVGSQLLPGPGTTWHQTPTHTPSVNRPEGTLNPTCFINRVKDVICILKILILHRASIEKCTVLTEKLDTALKNKLLSRHLVFSTNPFPVRKQEVQNKLEDLFPCRL